MSDAAFAAIVQRIQDATLDPDLWPDLTLHISDLMEERPLMLGVQWLPQGMSFMRSARIPPVHIERMMERYPSIDDNPLISAALPIMEPHKALRHDDLIPLSEFEKTDFHKDTVAPMGGLIGDIIMACRLSPSRLTAMVMARRPDQAPASAAQIAFIEALSPHLGHAIEVMMRLGHLSDSLQAMDQVLCRMAQPVALLDGERSIIFANTILEGVVADSPILSVRKGRFVALAARNRATIDAFLASAVAAGGDAPGETQLRLTDPASDKSLLLTAHPINAEMAADLSLGSARAIIFFSDFAAIRGDLIDNMAAQYRLSDQQSEILRRMLGGRPGNEIADALGITPNTYRTHTRRIFEKTGSTSREDLFRLMVGAAAQTPLRA